MRNCLFLTCLLWSLPTTFVAGASENFQIIAYHDVRDFVHDEVDADQYAISAYKLISHFQWLDANGFVPISVDDIIAARNGTRPLPEQAVLLTFDDGLESVYTHVFPLLKLFNYPAVVSVVTAWTNGESDDWGPASESAPFKFLDWEKVREMHVSGLVEIASHSHDLHHGLEANPGGSLQPAAATRWYREGSYETEQEYRRRVFADLAKSAEIIYENIGERPRVITWPYGAFNQVGTEIATELGMPISLTLESKQNHLDEPHFGRHLVLANPDVDQLGIDLLHRAHEPVIRAAQVDLDYIYDDDPAAQERNLDRLLDRIKALQISHVFLQAFADQDADGGAQALYFPNRHLPVRADLFSRVAWQLKTRSDVKVYGWLPILSFQSDSIDPALRVTQLIDGVRAIDTHSEPRLSVFDEQAQRIIKEIYADLASHAHIDGILFHDDGRLNEFEDANPSAIAAYRKEFGPSFTIEDALVDDELRTTWSRFKTRALISFTRELESVVRRYRPDIKTARNLFAPAVLNPTAENYLAQNLEEFLHAYDHIALMAMPYFEGAADPEEFFLRLISKLKQRPDAMEKTIFELQTVDWRTASPLPAPELRDTMRWLQSNGVKHIGYYPDDFILGQPELQQLRSGMSLAVYPTGLTQ